jgi:predicted transcriptional regulator
MSRKIIMISIRPHYAKKIFNGCKTVELRRIHPKIKSDDIILLYVTTPVKALAGAFKVDQVIAKSPEDLWEMVYHRAGVTREKYDEYYAGKEIGVAIFFSKVWNLPKPIGLHELQKKWPRFRPPQTHIYIKNGDNRKGFPFKLHFPDSTVKAHCGDSAIKKYD